MLQKTLHILIFLVLLLCGQVTVCATVYTVSDKATLQTRMNAALPGDTVIVANGSYDWGQIRFQNYNSISTSPWIVLKAQTVGGVEFRGTTYLQFRAIRTEVNGFTFANGNASTNAVVSFRYSSSLLSSYCRITNIRIDNYNTPSADSTVENEWVGLYGTNNRVDHCTFNNKYNARATVVVWYSSTTYPAPAISTFHRIDSNYFRGRSFLGANGGETIRVGDSNSSRTDGYNTIEFNLFEANIQTEPEIISNKSNFNTYRYNTFKNSAGGLTLRHGRYCSVYGNFFIVTDATVTRSYGVRVIDKGHKVFNNYFEGLLGNRNSLTSLRCPIILYNGLSGTNDTTDASKASGYFPADSTIVAFNTIVNCSGGAGIVIGYHNNGAYSFQPLGITVANNAVKMTTGQAAFKDASNTTLTYSAEGNVYQAPSGAGLTDATGFESATLNYGARSNGILSAPPVLQDAAISSATYTNLLGNLDVLSRTRSSIYDIGAEEINGTEVATTYPLDSNMVGAGKSFSVLSLINNSFTAILKNKNALLKWESEESISINKYELQRKTVAGIFETINSQVSNGVAGKTIYTYTDVLPANGTFSYRIKQTSAEGKVSYSVIKTIVLKGANSFNIYPNPVKDFFCVEIKQADLPATILLRNAAGQVVKIIALINGINKISLAGLSKGNYTVSINSSSQQTFSQLVFIQ